jgi:hypothetical protein
VDSSDSYSRCIDKIFARDLSLVASRLYRMAVTRSQSRVATTIASIHCWAVGAGIRCSRIWMVVSYELDRIVKICVFMASSVICSVVPISFLWKAIDVVKYWVTISSHDGQEVGIIRKTWVQPSFVEALSSLSLSTSHISAGSWMLLMSGTSSSQHPRCIGASAFLAWSCQLRCRGERVTPLPSGSSSTLVTIL